MQSEKEIQIQKINELLNSKDEKNIELGLQLMVSLGLMKELPERFQQRGVALDKYKLVAIGNERRIGNELNRQLMNLLRKIIFEGWA